MHKFAVIVAGGSGTRMSSEVPKQFLTLAGKPILMRTIETFCFDDIQIVVVLPENECSQWEELCREYDFKVPHSVIAGGNERFHSVKNGLASITQDQGLVAIHDGVRPLVTREVIKRAYTHAEKEGSAIASVPLKNSLRKINGSENMAVNRNAYRLIQTPQTFQLALIRQAFDTDYRSAFTDDASVLEHSGQDIHLIDGDYRNIKITTPEDLLVAESFYKDKFNLN